MEEKFLEGYLTSISESLKKFIEYSRNLNHLEAELQGKEILDNIEELRIMLVVNEDEMDDEQDF